MEKQTGNNQMASKLFLFPRHYAKIGRILIVVSLLGIAAKVSGFGIVLQGEERNYDPVLITIYLVLIVGLFIIAWTREKIEDEFTIRLRLLGIGISFVFAILTVIGIPLFLILTGGKAFHLNATYVVIEMLVVYLACLSFFKGFYNED